MDAYESGGRKFRAERLQFGEANQFQVHDREWSAKTRHRRSDFRGGFCNCEVAKLFTQGCSQAVGRNCIVVSENNIDRPHGKPLLKWRRGRQEPTR
jgi:hypothetical protein